MGGIGSGQGLRFNTKRSKGFVEEYESIDSLIFSSKLMQKLPTHGIVFNFHDVIIQILKDHLKISTSGRVLVVNFAPSSCHYGNLRYWMKCPHPKCFRRCRKLYLCKSTSGVSLFLCKECLNLAYRSQNKTTLDRLIDNKWKILNKFNVSSIEEIKKVKYMHRKTFEKLRNKLESIQNISLERIVNLLT